MRRNDMRIGIYLLLLPLLCQAAYGADSVPHVFASGTPARASEVNENFAKNNQVAQEAKAAAQTNSEAITTLASRVSTAESTGQSNATAITGLASRVEVLEASSGSSSTNKWFDTSWYPAVTYSAVSKSPGDSVTIGGKDCVMVRIPFIDDATGNKYHITLPAGVPSTGYNGVTLTTQYAPNASAVSSLRVSGYPATVSAAHYRTIGGQKVGLKSYSGKYTSINTGILVGSTILSVSFSMEVYAPYEQEVTSDGDYDYTDELTWAPMTSSVSVVTQAADDFIDLIAIEAVP